MPNRDVRLFYGAHAVALQKRLADLRAWAPEREVGLSGLEEIAAWFNSVRIVTRRGNPVSTAMVSHWIARFSLPAFRPHGTKRLVTTNYLLQAWMWTLRVRQQKQLKQTWKWKPGTIKMPSRGQTSAELQRWRREYF
jgi:hypothetical protein